MTLEPAEVDAIADAVAAKLAAKLAESPHQRAPLMKIREVAELLGYSVHAVRRMAEAGDLPSVRFNKTSERRFPREEIMDFINRQAKGEEAKAS